MLEIGHDVFFAHLNMVSKNRYCSRGVASFHGFEQAQMLLVRGDPARRIVQPVGSTLEHDALENMA